MNNPQARQKDPTSLPPYLLDFTACFNNLGTLRSGHQTGKRILRILLFPFLATSAISRGPPPSFERASSASVENQNILKLFWNRLFFLSATDSLLTIPNPEEAPFRLFQPSERKVLESMLIRSRVIRVEKASQLSAPKSKAGLFQQCKRVP
ncbi:hypothetical protein CDAR_218491 [Caerostris darwini]|uniref:Uncharacterized protein n=1 Tax=Caerostris darwini TaxID=1538125 RepID=A0AAV4RID8_9ARAC|nr:hypothetical protein CDAR_218491 [Caerostris darwini]